MIYTTNWKKYHELKAKGMNVTFLTKDEMKQRTSK